MRIADKKANCTTRKLVFPQLETEIDARDDETLFQSARRHGVRIVGACGGRGTCGSCAIRILEGVVVRNADGGERPGQGDGLKGGGRAWVQACQISARSKCVIEISPRSLAPIVRAETATGGTETLEVEAAVVARDLELPEATLADSRSDAERVVQAVGEPELSVDLRAAQCLPEFLRSDRSGSHWSLRAWRRGSELIGFGRTGHWTLGLAVDLGTTNVGGFLVDLETGKHLASLGVENPQVAWGADVISRLNHAIGGAEAGAELQFAAVRVINALARDLSKSVGGSPADIMDVVVCGNTAMHHLVLGLPVRHLGRAPFIAAVSEGLDVKAREIGLTVAGGAYAHFVPNVGGFVGGDHVAALLASEPLWQPVSTALVMDIGTNTEISVIHDGRIYSASAPSGPALEGGHITFGMRAAIGAIERVTCVRGRLKVQTIGRKKPIGLCGSGVLDAVAALHAAQIVNRPGTLARGHPSIVSVDDGVPGMRAAQLAPGVLFTQGDIRAVQLAKAAIRTATDLLLDEAGVRAENIDRFIIAGSFGAYLSVASGVAIGLFAPLPPSRFLQIGNAAGVGVRQMLAAVTARDRAKVLAKRCQYIELNTRKDFQKSFLRNIHIGNRTHQGQYQ